MTIDYYGFHGLYRLTRFSVFMKALTCIIHEIRFFYPFYYDTLLIIHDLKREISVKNQLFCDKKKVIVKLLYYLCSLLRTKASIL